MNNKLNEEVALELLIKDQIKERSDLKKTENRWILHSIYVGLASRRIAFKLGLDSGYAMALGFIHDIGRKIDHFNHPIEGYNYLIKLGYVEEAKISLTHSFVDNQIENTAGGGPKDLDSYNFINDFLIKNPPTLYDNIIQLCDLFCLETGFTTIEKRLLDLCFRKGIYSNSYLHFQNVIKLKEKLESKMKCNLYDLFPEIEKDDLNSQYQDKEKLIDILKDNQKIKCKN